MDESTESTALKIALSELANDPDETVVIDREERTVESPVVGDGLKGIGNTEDIGVEEESDKRYPTRDEVNREELVFKEKTDKTITNSYQFPGGLPLNASGRIDTLLLVGNSSDFKVYVQVDDNVVIDRKSYSDLATISNELPHVSAYETGTGKYVVSVTDYVFSEKVDANVTPTNSSATFDNIRTEIQVDNYTTEVDR